jgi:taurine--2-oxoglutarate transaminase
MCAAGTGCSPSSNWKDRSTREPLAPWPETHPALGALLREAMSSGVSFATRGNLVILAPPLVIGEKDLADALGLLDRLLGALAI